MLLKRLDLDENGLLKFGFFFMIFKFIEECFMVGYKMNRKEGFGKFRF